MVDAVKFLLLSCCFLLIVSEDITKVSKKNIFLQRRKRYLTFPAGSNFAIQIASVKALLRLQPTGWNILEEMDFPFALPSDTRWLEQFKGQKRERREVYNQLGLGISQAGMNGTACVQRMICDAQKYIPLKGKSLVKDILLALFSFPGDAFDHQEICTASLSLDCSTSILDYIFGGHVLEPVK